MPAYDPSSAIIQGLRMSVDSATQRVVTVDTGVAYLPDTSRILVGDPIVTNLSGLTASTWYHVYVYAPTPSTAAVEIVPVAPAVPYIATARAKTGDLTRRYVGSIYSNSASKITPFRHVSAGQTSRILFIEGLPVANVTAGGLTMLAAGTSTAVANVSALTAVPITTSVLEAQVLNRSNFDAYLGNPEQPVALSTNSAIRIVTAQSCAPVNLPLSSAGQFNYMMAASNLLGTVVSLVFSGSLLIQANGYVYDR